ncbi:MAG: aldo/keto reductase, partial [Gemmatimonadetes bacterium]|nr:aldo/keto reductase [Gemmatimonadota bacterium]
TAERDLLPMARHLDLGVTPWGVLGAGVLSGKYTRGAAPAPGRAAEGGAKVERNLAIARAVAAVADELGCTSSQAAAAWVRQQPGVIVPIVGARTLEQLRDNLDALNVTQAAAHLARLDEVSAVEPGFPYDFLGSAHIRNIIYGGTYDRIEHHRRR